MDWILGIALVIILLMLIDLRLLRKAQKGLAVLSYDDIDAKILRKQLSLLKKRGWHFITAADLAAGKKVSAKSVLITFAGGYENFYTDAFPVLKEMDIPCLVFLPAAGIGGYNFWHDTKKGPWRNMLTAAQIKELQKSGLAGFGSCGLTGAGLNAADEDIAENEVIESAARLNNIYGVKPDFFYFPRATRRKAQKRLINTAEKTYKFVFTDGNRVNTLPLGNILSYIPVGKQDNFIRFLLKLTGRFAR